MPEVPEPLAAPSSLGGLDIEIEGEVPLKVDSSMSALSERAGELKEDIEELQELKEAIREVDNINNEEIELKQLENTEEP